MSQKCSNCSQENPDGSAFCRFCHQMLQQATGPTAAAQQSYQGGYSQQQHQQPFPGGGSQGLPPQQGSTYPGTAGMYSAPPPSPPLSAPVQMGTLIGGKQLFARRAFAGRGTSITHESWLLKGAQAKAGAVFAATRDLLAGRKQEVLELNVESNPLKDVGVRADRDEERLYIVLKRGVTTIFLYIAPVGSNLYISRTTTVLPLISLMRIGILLLGATSTFVVGPVLSSGLGNFSPFQVSSLLFTFLLIFLNGLVSLVFFWLPVITLTIPSLVHAIKEGDFWVYLRERALTSFQVDDVMVMERLTDYILSVAVEQVGLNRDLIEPPKDGYKPKQIVRGF